MYGILLDNQPTLDKKTILNYPVKQINSPQLLNRKLLGLTKQTRDSIMGRS